PGALFTSTATEISGVDERRAGGVELRHEGAFGAADCGLEGPRRRREVGREGKASKASHVGVAQGVHGDPEASVKASAPEEGRVEEGGASGIELRHEGVAAAAAEGALEGRCRRGEDGG